MDRTLSRAEARVVLDLEWRNQKTVALAELRAALGASDSYARKFAHRLVQKGWLERVRPGLFRLVPADRGREGVADTHPLSAGAALAHPYFFSFGTACTHHGLTEQAFAEVYLACREHRRPETIRGKRYIFVYVRKERFFGFAETQVLGEAVQMATVERALLDAIDRPVYAGGIGEVSRIAARAASRVSWDALLNLLGTWRSSALAQRLGYFLDLHGVEMPREARGALFELVLPHSKIQLGSRRKWGTSGRLARPWNVVENVPRDVLFAGEATPRRRVGARGTARMPQPRLPPRSDVEDQPEVLDLFANLQASLARLEQLLRACRGHWGYEDGVYRFYHHSFKVYALQDTTSAIVAALQALAPARALNESFLTIVREGTGKTFEPGHNRRWLEVTRPIVEAFFHAQYFLEMAVRYGKELKQPPRLLPSGWAAFLYLYNLR